MILYNLRERGALEYDKFILNTFQIVDAINYRLQELQTENIFTDHINSVKEIYETVSVLFEELYLKYNVYVR